MVFPAPSFSLGDSADASGRIERHGREGLVQLAAHSYRAYSLPPFFMMELLQLWPVCTYPGLRALRTMLLHLADLYDIKLYGRVNYRAQSETVLEQVSETYALYHPTHCTTRIRVSLTSEKIPDALLLTAYTAADFRAASQERLRSAIALDPPGFITHFERVCRDSFAGIPLYRLDQSEPSYSDSLYLELPGTQPCERFSVCIEFQP